MRSHLKLILAEKQEKLPPIGKKEYIKKRKNIRCKCGSCKIVKAGFARKKQRYECKKCKRRFVDKKNKIRYKNKKQEILLELYLEGLGIRSISRIIGTNHVTLQYWIKDLSKKRKLIRPLYCRAIEIDELFFYTKRKKRKRYMWLAVCRDTSRILAWQTGYRSLYSLQKLMTKIKPIKCEHYYTDEFSSFRKVLPGKKHTASKKYTTTVEGINSSIRHFLARFRRRSKCYTKSESMLEATMNLFTYKYNEVKQAS